MNSCALVMIGSSQRKRRPPVCLTADRTEALERILVMGMSSASYIHTEAARPFHLTITVKRPRPHLAFKSDNND